jgi:hypothetical protein
MSERDSESKENAGLGKEILTKKEKVIQHSLIITEVETEIRQTHHQPLSM